MSTPRKKALFLLITRMRIFLLRGGTYRAFFKVNRLKYYKVVGKWGKAFKEVKSPMTRWHSFTWDFFRLLPYTFIGKQPTEKKHGWNCDGEWEWGDRVLSSSGEIHSDNICLFLHRKSYCDLTTLRITILRFFSLSRGWPRYEEISYPFAFIQSTAWFLISLS